MLEDFELIGTVTKRVDELGSLDIVVHLDKSLNAVYPSNRDFYFDVAYTDNPANIVTISNSITVRHIEIEKELLVLETDEVELNEGERSILTVTGEKFASNKTINVKLWRKVSKSTFEDEEEITDFFEIENRIVTSNQDGRFSFKIHYNESNLIENPSLRTFVAKAWLVEKPSLITISNTVDVNHLKTVKENRLFKILTRSQEENKEYFDYSSLSGPTEFWTPETIEVQYRNEEDFASTVEKQEHSVLAFKIKEYDEDESDELSNIPNPIKEPGTGQESDLSDLNIRWEYAYVQENASDFWSSYYYNWDGINITDDDRVHEDNEPPVNWNTIKNQYFFLDLHGIQIADYDPWRLQNWRVFLLVKLFVNDVEVDREIIYIVTDRYEIPETSEWVDDPFEGN